MSVEIKQPELNNSIETREVGLPVSSAETHFVEDIQTPADSYTPQEKKVNETINTAIRDGKVKYDDPKIKERNIDPRSASSWRMAIDGKDYGKTFEVL